MGVSGVSGAVSKAIEAASNSPGQAKLAERAQQTISKMIIGRAINNINTNAQKSRGAIKGEGG